MRYKIESIKDEQRYQHTGIMILIKAVRDIFNKAPVYVANSLNQGFFIYFNKKDATPVTASDVERIREKMQEIIYRDLPIEKHWMPCREAVRIWKEEGFDEKARLFEDGDPEQQVIVYELDGYRDYFYSEMLPSTGWLELFEVRPYRNGLLLRHPSRLHPDGIPKYRDDDKLYEAFAESKRMRKALKLDYLADLNKKTDDEIREIIKESEKIQENEIASLAERIVNEDRKLVLVAGPSSSGKTTFAKKLCWHIEKLTNNEPLYLGTDDYFLDREEIPTGDDGEQDFEGLVALDIELFRKQIQMLLAGEKVDIPEFDFIEGRKVFGRRVTQTKNGQIVIIEGIHSFNPALTEGIPAGNKFKVYISPLTRIGIDAHNRLSTTDARLFRRMVRDYNFRGATAASTLRGWPKVRKGENVNIFPYSSMADAVFNSSLVYETSLLKHYAMPLLMGIKPDQPEYEEARRLLDLTNCFKTIELVDEVPQDSILREFIGR